MTDLLWSFSPWFVFLIASRFTSYSGAAALGFIAAIAVLVRAASDHHLHMLDVVSPCYFAALAVVPAVLHPDDIGTWSRYAQLGSHLALTVIVFGSIAVGRPFTESYAKHSTPEALWNTKGFREANRRISTAWGLAFLVGDVSLALAGSSSSRQALLRVILPFGSLYLAYRYTVAQQVEARSEGPSATQPS
jgi:hypothetical protein